MDKKTGQGTCLKKRFSKAVEAEDLDTIQKIALSEEGSSDEFHKEIWEEAEKRKDLDPEEVREAFKRFRIRIAPQKRRKGPLWISLVISAAACILLVLFLWKGQDIISLDGRPDTTDWMECMAREGEMKELTLADGTHIWLNSDSHLIYPEKFHGKYRKVFISGEGYFEVARDPEHPFIVQSDGVDIEVTGTKFDVRSYGDGFSTTLIEGGVEVSIRDTCYTLIPGERISGNPENGMMVLSKIPQNKYPTWFHGDFKAFNESLEDIVVELERRYDVRFVIRGQQLKESRFSFSFVNGEGLDEILDALNMDRSLKISRKDGIIEIY